MFCGGGVGFCRVFWLVFFLRKLVLWNLLKLNNVRDCMKCKYLQAFCAVWKNTLSVVLSLLSIEY